MSDSTLLTVVNTLKPNMFKKYTPRIVVNFVEPKHANYFFISSLVNLDSSVGGLLAL